MEALPPVEGNAFELRDALVLLIHNAVDAMPKGGSLAIRAAAEASGWVVVEVRDSGVGMSDETRRRLAEHARSLQPGRGSSQGLAHVYDIVERHGGSVAIESEIGKGTTVRLRLHASRFQIIPASEGLAERQVSPDQAARVLLVDDDPRLLSVLSDVLSTEGHAITTDAHGEGAHAVSTGRPRRGDRDLGMPRMNGWQVAQRVKSRSPGTAVFILTGWGEGVSAHESMQFVDRVIAKPVSAEALLEQLAGLTRSRVVPPA
jgi:CheY-like chemotaxis protein